MIEASTSPDAPTTTPPPTPATGAAADALVVSLMDAYNSRDWDTVRQINTNHSERKDQEFTEGYERLQRRGACDAVSGLEMGLSQHGTTRP